MDDTTRMIIAYAVLFFGIPPLAAKILWVFPGAISGFILDKIAGGLRQFTDAVIEGFISLVLACLLFEQLQTPVAMAVPAVLIGLHLIWNWAVTKEEALNAWPSVAGIVAGFSLYPKIMTLLPLDLRPLA
jgi:hypothetical protein